MDGSEPRRRRRIRRSGAGGTESRPPSPTDLAEMARTFASTSAVHDPSEHDPGPVDAEPVDAPIPAVDAPHTLPTGDETPTERGLRGLVGGGSSQVSVSAALRARDAARPTGADFAAAEA